MFEVKNKLVEAGLLNSSQFQNLISYNYTDQCAFDKHWIPETLESRGSIYDLNTGKIVARSFDKFFNLGEYDAKIENLPQLAFDVDEKMDGSLGILYQFPGESQWRVATRGSFYSDQARQAEIILEQYQIERWPEGWTPLVEIIYPSNRIVIDYGKESKLVLLAGRNIETGAYMDRGSLDMYANRMGMPRPKRYEGNLRDLIERAKGLPGDHEGWVLTYRNGYKVKIKGVRYLELAKFASHLSRLSIYEVMLKGPKSIQEFMVKMPEELLEAAQAIYNEFLTQLGTMLTLAEDRATVLQLRNPYPDKDFYKTKALLVAKEPKWMRSYLMEVMRKSKFPEKALLRYLLPKANRLVDLQEIFKNI